MEAAPLGSARNAPGTWTVSVLLALLLAAGTPVASAGTEGNPEIQGEAGDAGSGPLAGSVDFLSAWFTEFDSTVAVWVKIADLRELVPGARYEVRFSQLGEPYAVIFTVDWDGHLGGTYNVRNGSQGFREIDVDYTDTRPGVITGHVDRRWLHVNAGEALTNLSAHTRLSNQWSDAPAPLHFRDDVESDAEFRLERHFEVVYASPAPGALLALAGAGAALALRRRR